MKRMKLEMKSAEFGRFAAIPTIPLSAGEAKPLVKLYLAERELADDEPFWISSQDTTARDVLVDLEEIEEEPEDGEELTAITAQLKPDKSKQDLEPRLSRVPPAMFYREPTQEELMKKDPPHHQAVAGKHCPITLPRFWEGDSSTPRRKLFLAIRYKDVVPKVAEVYVYNGRTFLGNRRGHYKGYRRLGYLSGLDDGRWKTAIFETSPFDLRHEERWKGTQVLIHPFGKSTGVQEVKDLPVQYVAVYEPSRELEMEARKQWRAML